MYLSKSQYLRGLQCTKSLWLYKNKKELITPPDASAQAIFATGDMVGELACELFPDGKKIEFEGTTFAEKEALTKTYIDDGVKNIYEATFIYDGIVIMIDICHINEDGTIELYEVKSSTSLKDVYLDDVSIQLYVLEGLGYEVKKASVIYLNNKYIRGDKLEIEKLFCITDVTQEAKELQENIPTKLKHFQTQLSKTKEPTIMIGKQCSYPYECDFKEYCWRDVPEYSVFNITRLKSDKKFALYHDGIVEISQISDIESFTTSQQIQIKAEKENKTILNKTAINEFLETLSYPIYHLDFETFQQAVPQWEGVSPFMQIPFQYSLHIQNEDGTLNHKEFLAKEGEDPRYELAKRLVEDIPTDVTVLAYNMSFEKGVIEKLAQRFPEFETKLLQIHDNIKDLMIPFAKKDFYTPAMRGSYSIKYVLPALVPEMAEAYKKLNDVQNGSEAMQTYAKLANISDKKEVAKLRESLLRYCELDTLAMVRVLKRLKEVVK